MIKHASQGFTAWATPSVIAQARGPIYSLKWNRAIRERLEIVRPLAANVTVDSGGNVWFKEFLLPLKERQGKRMEIEITKDQREAVRRMIMDGMPLRMVARLTALDMEVIQELADRERAPNNPPIQDSPQAR